MRRSRARSVRPRLRVVAVVAALAMVVTVAPAAGAKKAKDGGFLTAKAPYITLDPGVPDGSSVQAIISVGDTIGDFVFEGIPDGIGLAPRKGKQGKAKKTVDVFVAHEQSTVPFRGRADFEDASVSRLTLDLRTGAVVSAEVAIPASDGYIRFCSAFMAGPDEGFKKYTFFVGEESNDILDVPAGAPYGADPALAPQRQAGYAVALDVTNGKYTAIPGMGRHNHENTIVVPGGWHKQMALLSTDDTFDAPSAQLYLYLAKNDRQVWKDRGHLWAFRVTAANGVRVDPADPFNDANDYLDIQPGGDFQGEFIRVPDDVADGTTGEAPQDALENWSNANNVFQFIRLEDLDYDRTNPRVVYIADTGASRVIPDGATGRLVRGPTGTDGFADNGRIFKLVFNEDDPTKVDSLTVLADGDAPGAPEYVPFTSPDNVGISSNSLMVQEDTDNAKVWRLDFSSGAWSVVATVNDPDGESSGIVDASRWFGPGTWMLDVQAHGTNESEMPGDDGVLYKREDGQLLLMTIPGS